MQPRIRLMRSFDERSHSYLGYILRVQGTVADQDREFEVAIGPGAQAKRQFHQGNQVEGVGVPVEDPRLETAELYKGEPAESSQARRGTCRRAATLDRRPARTRGIPAARTSAPSQRRPTRAGARAASGAA